MHRTSRALVLASLFASASAAADEPTTGTQGGNEQEETVDLDAGGELGYARLDDINYVAPTLAADLRLSLLQSAIRIPLRFESASGEVRKKDWDETGDYLRVAQCVRFDWHSEGRFERERGMCVPWQVQPDDYYVSVRMGPLYAVSLAHGTIVGTYSNNLDPDHFQSGLYSQVQLHEFVHGRLTVDDVTNPSLVAGVLQLLPFAYELPETRQWYAESSHLRIQATAVSDIQAPNRVLTAFGRPLTDGAGNLLFTTAPVTVVGANLEYAYAFGTQLNLQVRGDWNWITSNGMGGHGQLWFIYNHPDGIYSVRAEGEFRYVQRNYIPTYFDSYYEIQRQQYALVGDARDRLESGDDELLTKRQFLGSLPDDSWDPGLQAGFEFEYFKLTANNRRRAFFARAFFGNTFGRTGDGQFVVAAEIPRLANKIDLYGLYTRQSFDALGDIFTLNDTLVKVMVRWDLTERFYVLMNYGRLWQLSANPDGTTESGFQSSNDFTVSLGVAEELQ